MPRIELTTADTPFGECVGAGFSYPVRGAGLGTCVVLALIHVAGLLPSCIGKQQNLRDSLLVHGRIWMAALIAAGESRRSLGVLQDCIGLDQHFIPDDPRTCNELARLAARSGKTRLVIQLGEGCLACWPHDPQPVAPGLLAARALAQHPDQHACAIGVLDRVQTRWPDHPLRDEIPAVRQQLRHSA